MGLPSSARAEGRSLPFLTPLSGFYHPSTVFRVASTENTLGLLGKGLHPQPGGKQWMYSQRQIWKS
jgi:hypothetical protein